MSAVTAPPRDTGSLGAGSAVLRALLHVAVRTYAGKLRRMLTRPLRLTLLVAAVAAVVALQALAITSQAPVVGTVPGTAGATAGLCAVLAVVSFSAVRTCPVRLRGADVAWLLPCPAAPRALVAWHVAATAGRAAVIGVAAAAGAALRDGVVGAVLWQPAVALAGTMLLVRGASTVTHLATVHGLPRRAVEIVTPALWVVAGLAPALTAVGLAFTPPAWLLAAGAPLRALAGPLVASVVAPAAQRWPALLAATAVAVALALLAIALGSGYQERAARQTWEMEAAIAAYKEGSTTTGVMAEMIAARLPAGVPSFTGLGGLRGEAALLWKAVAQLRRGWRSELRFPLALVAGAAVTALVAPDYAAAPLLPIAMLLLTGLLSGFVEEIEHLPVRTLPGVAWRKVLAVDAVPTMVVTVVLLLGLGPAVAVSGQGWAVALTSLLAVPGLAAAAIAAGSLAALWAPTVGWRVLASAALVTLSGAAALGTWSLAGELTRGPALLALGGLLAAAFWALAARQLVAGHR